jgi:hypothetical protein
MAYTFQGQRDGRGGAVARFSLAPYAPEPPAGADQPQVSRKVKGTGNAVVSLKDGMLRRLRMRSVSERKGERDGQAYSFTMKSSVDVRRGGARAPGRKGGGKKKGGKKGPEKKKSVVDASPAAQKLISGCQPGEKVNAFQVYDIAVGRSLCYI